MCKYFVWYMKEKCVLLGLSQLGGQLKAQAATKQQEKPEINLS